MEHVCKKFRRLGHSACGIWDSEILRAAVWAITLAWAGMTLAIESRANDGVATASSSQSKFLAAGATNGNRFSADPNQVWKGKPNEGMWWWQISFPQPRKVGSILQVIGDHESIMQNAPQRYMWRWSNDGRVWRNLLETQTMRERRLFRIHRLKRAVSVRYLRLEVFDCYGKYPTLREIEIYSAVDSPIEFEDWFVAVSIHESSKLPDTEQLFIEMARQCEQWKHLKAQNVWLEDFDESFIATEPHPICAFLSGSGRESCQRMHEPFRGMQQVLKNGNLPMWASCGSAQAFAFFSTVGIDVPWDCPRCRDPKNPKLPIYTHIGYKNPDNPGACGEYDNNIGERGPTNILQVGRDPAFVGLPKEFLVIESHIAQIDYVPEGWKLVLTRGKGAKTKVQCMRLKDHCIYAAQFHIEKSGTPENSQKIMSNFFNLAKKWGGYNTQGKAVENSGGSVR